MARPLIDDAVARLHLVAGNLELVLDYQTRSKAMKQTVLALMVALAAASAPSSGLARDYFYGYRGGYHASTAAEGYQRGMADIIRSRGQANLMNAQAAGYLEDARAKYLENRYRATEIYYERRKIYQQEQAAKHAKRKICRSRRAQDRTREGC